MLYQILAVLYKVPIGYYLPVDCTGLGGLVLRRGIHAAHRGLGSHAQLGPGGLTRTVRVWEMWTWEWRMRVGGNIYSRMYICIYIYIERERDTRWTT